MCCRAELVGSVGAKVNPINWNYRGEIKKKFTFTMKSLQVGGTVNRAGGEIGWKNKISK